MTILKQDIPEIRGLSHEQNARIFAVLDKDGNGALDPDEFMDFGTVLLLNLEQQTEDTTFVEKHLPSVFKSHFYQSLCRTVKSKRFESSIEMILVLNAFIIAAQDYPMLVGKEEVTETDRMEGVETIFTLVYALEALLKIMVNGWKHYIQSPRNCFDFVITILVLLATAYVYCKSLFWCRQENLQQSTS